MNTKKLAEALRKAGEVAGYATLSAAAQTEKIKGYLREAAAACEEEGEDTLDALWRAHRWVTQTHLGMIESAITMIGHLNERIAALEDETGPDAWQEHMKGHGVLEQKIAALEEGLAAESGKRFDDVATLTDRIAALEAEKTAWTFGHNHPEMGADYFHNYGDCGGNLIDGCGFKKPHVCSPEDCGMQPHYDFSKAKRGPAPEPTGQAPSTGPSPEQAQETKVVWAEKAIEGRCNFVNYDGATCIGRHDPSRHYSKPAPDQAPEPKHCMIPECGACYFYGAQTREKSRQLGVNNPAPFPAPPAAPEERVWGIPKASAESWASSPAPSPEQARRTVTGGKPIKVIQHGDSLVYADSEHGKELQAEARGLECTVIELRPGERIVSGETAKWLDEIEALLRRVAYRDAVSEEAELERRKTLGERLVKEIIEEENSALDPDAPPRAEVCSWCFMPGCTRKHETLHPRAEEE